MIIPWWVILGVFVVGLGLGFLIGIRFEANLIAAQLKVLPRPLRNEISEILRRLEEKL